MLLSSLKRNPGLKLFSLLLAIAIWSYVKYVSTPQAAMSSETRIKVALTVEGVGEQMVALGVPREVELTVKGDPAKLSKLEPQHFKAYLSLQDKKPGIYSIPVEVNLPPDIEKVKAEPAKVSVRLDPLEKRVFEVKVKTQGVISKGFILGKMSAQPASVTVLGAQSLIRNVKEVRAVCNVEDADMDIVQRVGVEIIDEDEKIIEGLKAEPAFVRVSIPVRNEIINSTVPITADITGVPDPAFKIEKIVITPPAAVIRYRYDLESPPASLKTEPLDVTGIKSSLAKETRIAAPGDVLVVEPENVKIHVMISPRSE